MHVSEQPLSRERPEKRKRRLETRRLIRESFGELLVLLSQRADHGILLEKVQALHRRFEEYLDKPKKSDTQL
jgi:hypothetical protein